MRLVPRTGMLAFLVLVSFAILVALIYSMIAVDQRSKMSQSIGESTFFLISSLVSIGIVFGMTSGLVWMATRLQNRWARYAARAVVVCSATWLTNRLGTDDWVRNVTYLVGLTLTQCTVFVLMKIPNWHAASATVDDVDDVRHQFQIVDLIVATTCVAGLSSAVLNYETPITASEYWVVTGLIWIAGPWIAVAVHRSVFDSTISRRVAWTMIATSIASIASFALAYAQLKVDQINTGDAGIPILAVVQFYAAFMIGYVLALYIFSIAGKLPPEKSVSLVSSSELASSSETDGL